MSCCQVSGLQLERRGFARRRVTLAGSAIALEGSRSVVVEDVSRTGARLRGRNLPARGAELMVRVEDRMLFGSVAWTAFDQRGIKFDEALGGESGADGS